MLNKFYAILPCEIWWKMRFFSFLKRHIRFFNTFSSFFAFPPTHWCNWVWKIWKVTFTKKTEGNRGKWELDVVGWCIYDAFFDRQVKLCVGDSVKKKGIASYPHDVVTGRIFVSQFFVKTWVRFSPIFRLI